MTRFGVHETSLAELFGDTTLFAFDDVSVETDEIDQIRPEADEIIALETPADFRAVGQFYRSFDQVTDEEAIEYLDTDSETSG